jgi:hypothetical protein
MPAEAQPAPNALTTPTPTTWRHALAVSLPSDHIARLVALAHPQLARIRDAHVDGPALVCVEAGVAGTPLEASDAATFTDKVLALATELVPALQALAQAGLAHGQIARERILRSDDGLVLVGASGLRADGNLATSNDDVRALLSMIDALLPANAPASIRTGLAALVAAPPDAADARALPAALVALRATIPIPPGRHVRSIKRLAFPPPVNPPKRSKRYLVRIVLITAIVGLGLMALLSAGPEVAWSDRADGADAADTAGPDASNATTRDRSGVVFIHTTPLPSTPAPKPGP